MIKRTSQLKRTTIEQEIIAQAENTNKLSALRQIRFIVASNERLGAWVHLFPFALKTWNICATKTAIIKLPILCWFFCCLTPFPVWLYFISFHVHCAFMHEIRVNQIGRHRDYNHNTPIVQFSNFWPKKSWHWIWHLKCWKHQTMKSCERWIFLIAWRS